MTLIELLIVIVLVGVLAAGVVKAVGDKLHKARLSRCFVELRSIQSTVLQETYETSHIPLQSTFWEEQWGGRKPGPYFYLTDAEDSNTGHGNDLDGFDEQNPGAAPREEKDLKFVILCQHDHAHLARYVYVEDEGPPTIALGPNNPHHDVFVKGGKG